MSIHKSKKTLSQLAIAIRRRKTSFWRRDYIVTPRLLDWIDGDGRLVITFTPLATRPDRYIIRIDSKTNMDSDTFYDDTLEAIYTKIEEEFGQKEEEWEHDNGRTYVRHRDFPALNFSCGCAWSEYLTLKKRDKRTEQEVRFELSQAVRRKRRPSTQKQP